MKIEINKIIGARNSRRLSSWLGSSVGKLERAEREAKKAASHWDDQARDTAFSSGLTWFENSMVQMHMNRSVSGDERVDQFSWLAAELGRRGQDLPLARALTLGCGKGDLEINVALKLNMADRHDAYDISPKSIETARARAAEAGLSDQLSYAVADVNALELPANTYDIVFCFMSAHHFEALEFVFEQVAYSLKPNGVFFLNEFVGPDRFQWTDPQVDTVNGVLNSLPEQYRQTATGSLRKPFMRPTIKKMLEVDPSESVRSSEIPDRLAERFRSVIRKDYGGTILSHVLNGSAWCYDPEQQVDSDIFAAIRDYESMLIKHGFLPSDYAVFLASDPITT